MTTKNPSSSTRSSLPATEQAAGHIVEAAGGAGKRVLFRSASSGQVYSQELNVGAAGEFARLLEQLILPHGVIVLGMGGANGYELFLVQEKATSDVIRGKVHPVLAAGDVAMIEYENYFRGPNKREPEISSPSSKTQRTTWDQVRLKIRQQLLTPDGGSASLPQMLDRLIAPEWSDQPPSSVGRSYFPGWTPPRAEHGEGPQDDADDGPSLSQPKSIPEGAGSALRAYRKSVGAKSSQNALRDAWIEKTRQALDLICAATPDELLASSLAKGEPVETLLEVLASVETLSLTAPAEDMMASVRYMEELVKKARGVIGSTGAAALLKISRQALDKRRRNGKLLAIKSRGDWGYPACQFEGPEVLNGLEPILKARAGEDAYVTLEFLLAPEPGLGGLNILEALRQGGDLAKIAGEIAKSAEGEQYS